MNARLIVFMLFLVLHASGAGAMEASQSPTSHPLPVGSVMPNLLLRGELTPDHITYLGLKGPAPRHLSDIGAKTVILVAFSMYCPHCQREAPILNEMHRLIASRGLAGDVKLIGVGIGNSDFEVQVFKEKYGMTFPLFSDPDFTLNKEIGEVGTPFFYVLRYDGREIRVADTQLGRVPSAESFLDRALGAAGQGR